MHIAVPHKFSQSEAAKRVKKALTDARPQFADKVEIHEERWQGDTLHFDFTAQTQRVSGTLVIGNAEYVIDAKLPFMLRLFEGRIEKEINAQIAKML